MGEWSAADEYMWRLEGEWQLEHGCTHGLYGYYDKHCGACELDDSEVARELRETGKEV